MNATIVHFMHLLPFTKKVNHTSKLKAYGKTAIVESLIYNRFASHLPTHEALQLFSPSCNLHMLSVPRNRS